MLKRSENYNKDFVSQNMMGPNSILILEELLTNITLKPGMRVLDLGCGMGLTSIFLAKEFGVEVVAVDLMISPTDNYNRFNSEGVADLVMPLHADANNLPFAEEYFDAVISVDSYHYYGNNTTYFGYLKKFLKKNGLVAIAFPGMKSEVQNAIPEDMKDLWEEEALEMWHSIDWWKPKFEPQLSEFVIREMTCFDQAWNEWLETENPYAVEDRIMMKTDNGRYMNLIALTGYIR